jgi:hypothetical protein
LLVKKFKRDAKMPVCLWKDCEFVSEDMAAFQEHVNTKHVLQPSQQQQQQQHQKQLNFDNKNIVGMKKEETHGRQIAKKAKMNEDKKVTNRRGQR